MVIALVCFDALVLATLWPAFTDWSIGLFALVALWWGIGVPILITTLVVVIIRSRTKSKAR